MISAVGEWSAADVWVRSSDEAWKDAVRVNLYARVGETKVLLQSKLIAEGTTTLDAGVLSAFVLSQRGPRASAFEVHLFTEEEDLPGSGSVSLRVWSNRQELPFFAPSRYPADVAASSDTIVRRDASGRARTAGLDLSGTSILWDAGLASATIGWAGADPSTDGAHTFLSGQKGAAGSDGGGLTLAGGEAGTIGTDFAGDVTVDLGDHAGLYSAALRVVVDDDTFAQLRYFAGQLAFRVGDGQIGSGNTGLLPMVFESAFATLVASTGDFIVSSSVSDVVLNCATSGGDVLFKAGLSTALTLTPRPSGASTMVWANGVTSLSDSIAQKASGAGVARSLYGQQGASGSRGGNFSLGAGNGGGGTDQAGDLIFDLGNLNGSGDSAPLIVKSAGTDRVKLHTQSSTTTLLDVQSGAFTLKSANNDAVTVGNGYCILTATSGGMYLKATNTSASFVWRGNADAVIRTDAFDPSGACSMTWAGTVTSIVDAPLQKSSGAGASRSISAGQGAAGVAGGDVTIGVGDGGTPGADAPGNVIVALGTPVHNVSGRQQWTAGGSVLAQLYQYGGDLAGIRIGTGNVGGGATGAKALTLEGSSLTFAATTGVVALTAGSDVHLSHAAGQEILHREASSTVLTEKLDADGASSLSLSSGTTSWTVSQDDASSGAGAGHTYAAQGTTASGQAGGALQIKGGVGDPGGNVQVLGGGGVVGNNGDGGHAHVAGGGGGGSGVAGNVALCSSAPPGSWESMSRGIFVGRAAAAPSDSPVGGHWVYGLNDGSLQGVNEAHLRYALLPRGGPSAFGGFTFDSEVANHTASSTSAETIASRVMDTGAVYQVDVHAIGWDTTSNNAGSYRKTATFKRSAGGTSADVGTADEFSRDQEDVSGWAVTITRSSNTISVNVTGSTGAKWIAEIHWRIFKP